jgi:hypothetical protein
VSELVLIAALALTSAVRLHIYSEIDERANFSYVAIVANQQRLPVLGQDCVSAQIAAVDNGPHGGPCSALEYASYEAFEPPLYYIAAAPVFTFGDSYRSRLVLLRLFDCVLFFAAIAISVVFVRQAWPGEQSWPILAGVLLVYLWPDLIVRGVTVSNTALELPLAQLMLLVSWRAWRSRGSRALLAAAVLFALCLLTKLTLVYLVVPFAALLVHRLRSDPSHRSIAAVAAAMAIPLVVLGPWVAFNKQHYGSLTADSQARTMQEPLLNPQHITLTASDLPGRNARLLTILPQEFSPAAGPGSALRRVLDVIFKVALIALMALAALASTRFRALRERLWLLVPLLAAVVLLNLTLLLANWDIFILRYLNAALPWAAAFGAFALVLSVRSPRRVALVLAAGLAGETLIWAHYAA